MYLESTECAFGGGWAAVCCWVVAVWCCDVFFGLGPEYVAGQLGVWTW